MADFNLAMDITGDGSSAVAAVDTVSGKLDELANSQEGAKNSGEALKKTAAETAAQLQAQAKAINDVIRATNPAVSSQQALDAAVRRVQASTIAGKTSVETYTRAQQIASRATFEHTSAVGNNRIAQMELMHVVRASADAFAAGQSPLRIMTMEMGRLAEAASFMGGGAGALGTFAKFMSTGWGMAITIGVAALAPLISGLFQSADAAKQAEIGADALGKAQSVLAGMFDETSGRIKHQNELLLVNARLTAINLQAEAMAKRQSANETFQSALQPRGGMLGSAFSALTGGDANRGANMLRPYIQAIRDAKTPQERAKALDRALQGTNLQPGADASTDPLGNLTNVSGAAFRQAIVDYATADQNESISKKINSSLDTGRLDPGLLRDHRAPRPKKQKDPAILENYGLDMADKLDQLGAGFQDIPPQVEKVSKATDELDKILRDVERRKPPNLSELLVQGEKIRAIIRDGLQKPYRDFLDDQQKGLEVTKLLAAGHEDEAAALVEVNKLEKAQGDLLPEQKAAILSIIQARKAEERQIDILHEKQQSYLDAIQSTKDAVRAVFDLSGKGLADLPKRLGQTFEKLLGDVLFEKFFGQAFRELQDQVKGTHIVEDASTRMGDAIALANNAIGSLGDAASKAASALSNGPSVAGSRGASLEATVAGLQDGASPAAGSAPAADSGDAIVVTGHRTLPRGIPTDPAGFMGFVVDKLLVGLNIFGDKASASISKAVGNALEGAAIGSAAGGLVFGNKSSQSKTGSAIGGALGEVAGKALGSTIASAVGGGLGKMLGSAAGPIGAIAGGLLGSLVGGLFAPKAKSGEANISSLTGNATLRGNGADLNQQSAGLAGNVQSGLNQIMQQLGGAAGNFNVSIGTYKDTIRVNPTGGATHGSGGGFTSYGTDQNAAIGAAISAAIAQGAISGLSFAVQRALTKYGSDINRSLAEAVSVQKVETLLKGIGGQFDETFRAFETQAAERLRIAREYGFDVVKLEQLNAQERADTFATAIKNAVGSLQSLLDSMHFGDLFEGTPMEQRAQLIGKIATTKADALAGKAGSGDALAALETQLVNLSRSAFGTAGPEYSADRASAERDAQQVVDQITAQARAAQDAAIASLNAQTQQVTLQNEANGILSQQLAALQNINAALGYGGVAAGASTNLSVSTARSVSL